jgi:hypothetical protein
MKREGRMREDENCVEKIRERMRNKRGRLKIREEQLVNWWRRTSSRVKSVKKEYPSVIST